MAEIEIYTKPTCPFCIKAKALLDSKGVSYTEIGILGDDELRAKMIERAEGKSTVPQIFIDGYHVGGCDDLFDHDGDGRLDELLNGSGSENGLRTNQRQP